MSGQGFTRGFAEGVFCGFIVSALWAFLYLVAAFGAWELNPGHWNAVLRGVVAFVGFVLSVAAFCDMRAKL